MCYKISKWQYYCLAHLDIKTNAACNAQGWVIYRFLQDDSIGNDIHLLSVASKSDADDIVVKLHCNSNESFKLTIKQCYNTIEEFFITREEYDSLVAENGGEMWGDYPVARFIDEIFQQLRLYGWLKSTFQGMFYIDMAKTAIECWHQEGVDDCIDGGEEWADESMAVLNLDNARDRAYYAMAQSIKAASLASCGLWNRACDCMMKAIDMDYSQLSDKDFLLAADLCERCNLPDRAMQIRKKLKKQKCETIFPTWVNIFAKSISITN